MLQPKKWGPMAFIAQCPATASQSLFRSFEFFLKLEEYFRHGLGVGVLEGPLYAVGGHDGWSYLNTVERYDPCSRAWSYVAPMTTQRSTVGVAVLNGRLYAVGGRDGSCCLKTVECYDPHTNRWTVCAPMAKRRGGVGVGRFNSLQNT